MSPNRLNASDARIQSALTELQALISHSYPEATFEVSQGDDPEGIYLTPTVDVEDTEEVFDVVVDRLLEMQIDELLPVYVIPVRPVERVVEEMQRRSQARPFTKRGHLDPIAVGLHPQ